MRQQQDNLVLLLLSIAFLIMLGRYLYRRYLYAIPQEEIDPNDEVVQLLESEGYIPIQRKVRIPITIHKEENEEFETRYYIDAIARKDGLTYAVKVAKPRKPLEMTGPSIRDQLIPIYLLGSWDGILYLDMEQSSVICFTFYTDTSLLPKRRNYWPYLLFFLFGVIITLLFT
jgi:hypothetical protein